MLAESSIELFEFAMELTTHAGDFASHGGQFALKAVNTSIGFIQAAFDASFKPR
jgi:hypothetical protein